MLKKQGLIRTLIGMWFSLVAPGIGHAFLGMFKRAMLWFFISFFFFGLCLFSVWFLVLSFALRVVVVVDLWIHRSSSSTSFWKVILPTLLLFCVHVASSLGLRHFVVEAFKIPTSSMEPTLKVGDRIFTSKVAISPVRGEVVVFVYPCSKNKDFIKRVIAVEGDLVEVRCNQVYVNEQPISQTPLAGECNYQEGSSRGWETLECKKSKETLDGKSYEIIHNGRGMDNFPLSDVPSCANDSRGDQASGDVALGTIVKSSKMIPPIESCERYQAYKVPEGHFFAMGDNRNNSADSRIHGAIPNTYLKAKAKYIWYSKQEESVLWRRIGKTIK